MPHIGDAEIVLRFFAFLSTQKHIEDSLLRSSTRFGGAMTMTAANSWLTRKSSPNHRQDGYKFGQNAIRQSDEFENMNKSIVRSTMW